MILPNFTLPRTAKDNIKDLVRFYIKNKERYNKWENRYEDKR